MNQPTQPSWDDHRDTTDGSNIPADQQPLWEAETRWLDVLHNEAAEPLPDAAAFRQGVLEQWEKVAIPDAPAEAPSLSLSDAPQPKRQRPLNISRWWGIAAALVLAVCIGWLAGREGGSEGPMQAGGSSDMLAEHPRDPVGVLMQDISKQIEERPQQVRRAWEDATSLLGGSWLGPNLSPADQTNGDGRRS
ncbi:MAG: hypothetical protein WD294_06770 [Phycisphaeraceae bacterium]